MYLEAEKARKLCPLMNPVIADPFRQAQIKKEALSARDIPNAFREMQLKNTGLLNARKERKD